MESTDMQIEKLLKYQGISPCPADFDEYWEAALAEMNSVKPNAEFIKKEFPSKNTDMYHLYYTGTKNARIHAKVAVPNNIKGKMPAVLMFHGLRGSSDDWSDLLKYTSQGFVVAFMEARGQGGMSEDVGGALGTTSTSPVLRGIDDDKNNLLMRDVYLDTALLAKIIMNLDYVDRTRVAVTGGSQGGGLSVVCACLVPEIKKCAPYYPYLSDFKGIYELAFAGGAHEGLNYYFKYYDPTHKRADEMFEKLGYIDIQNLAKRMKAELLMFTALKDRVCPPLTQFAMYNKVTSKKDIVFYHDYDHEKLLGVSDLIFEFLSDL